jgi:hypothetical protein
MQAAVPTTVTAESITAFLTLMSALSAATQQLVEHVLKKGLLRAVLDDPKMNPTAEAWRSNAVHGLAFLLGGSLAWSVGIMPLSYLGLGADGVAGNVVLNAILAGVMVAFGGSFFDEALGAVRAFKKAQEAVHSPPPVRSASGVALPSGVTLPGPLGGVRNP